MSEDLKLDAAQLLHICGVTQAWLNSYINLNADLRSVKNVTQQNVFCDMSPLVFTKLYRTCSNSAAQYGLVIPAAQYGLVWESCFPSCSIIGMELLWYPVGVVVHRLYNVLLSCHPLSSKSCAACGLCIIDEENLVRRGQHMVHPAERQ